MFNPSVALGSVMAAFFAAGATALTLMPAESGVLARSLDITDYRLVGQGCGVDRQKTRIYVAVEEDDLPGPACEIVFELVERDYK